jgi:hypothetical protein
MYPTGSGKACFGLVQTEKHAFALVAAAASRRNQQGGMRKSAAFPALSVSAAPTYERGLAIPTTLCLRLSFISAIASMTRQAQPLSAPTLRLVGTAGFGRG